MEDTQINSIIRSSSIFDCFSTMENKLDEEEEAIEIYPKTNKKQVLEKSKSSKFLGGRFEFRGLCTPKSAKTPQYQLLTL